MKAGQPGAHTPQQDAPTEAATRYPGTHRVRMLDLLSDEESKAMTYGWTTVKFTRGQSIVARGAVPRAIYFLTEGRVVSKDVSAKGQEFVVRFFAPGDFFSWLFMFRRTPSVFEYEAQSPCAAKVIDLDHFEELFRQDASLLLRLNRVLVERLESAYMVTNEYITESVVPRVAHLIGRLGRRYGNGSNHPALKGFSQQDIASLAGMSRPRVSEALAVLQKAGLLTVRREVLILTDVEKLLAFQLSD